MTTKTDFIAAIVAAADAYYTADPETGAAVKIAFGSPGTKVVIAGQKFSSGKAWEDEPKSIPTQIEGLADHLDTLGITETPTIKAKLNELIASYTQLISDYDNGIVPTTAAAVLPLA